MYVISRARRGVISAKLCTLQGIKSSLSALRSRVISAVKNAFNVSSCINRDRSRVFRASPHNAMASPPVDIRARRAENITTSLSDCLTPLIAFVFWEKFGTEDPIIVAAYASSKFAIESFHASDPDNFPSLEFGSINRGQKARFNASPRARLSGFREQMGFVRCTATRN